MKPTISSRSQANSKKANLLVGALGKRIQQAYAHGRYADALQFCHQAMRIAPGLAQPWIDAAACHLQFDRWDEAIGCAEQALARKGNTLALFDALAEAWGGKGVMDQAQRWGNQALAMRAAQFTRAPVLKHDTLTVPLPPLPSAETRTQNLIAFSLFGASSKYCETAVLNVIEQPRVYPHWICRFYVDETVPTGIVERLHKAGAEVVSVDAARSHWPGQLWRFFAYDMPGLHRVIFRDADSVVGEREAEAVAEWVASGMHFHHMRDNATHTELLLAGMWGVSAGALPPMQQLAERFMSRPLQSTHFADQYFLREFVWPYAHQSLLQHDSVFGFMDARPFPSEAVPADSHVGYSEGSPFFDVLTDLGDGTPVHWELVAVSAENAPFICRYPAIVTGGAVRGNLPARYARRLERGELIIRVKADARE
ncbi:tetratricopeptide repeat protein [Paraburkholderia sp. RAU2J]|uniref:tetratricopeptide repeat protein n=1 Tax=Paraburkholderia sp. RAU2J TaxID=1938810 RepID=UPI000EB4A9AE|nr:tetratricopeptide repeat protein [Paraburkholderia sp. RAU2J]